MTQKVRLGKNFLYHRIIGRQEYTAVFCYVNIDHIEILNT